MALFFPLHLLVATLVAAVVAFVARRCRARLAAWVFGLVVVLTAVMALTPTIAVWQRARQLDVPVWPKNSCGVTLVVFEQAPKPFTTL